MSDLNLSNPFPGLRSFTAQEGELFFGCEKQEHELLKRLRRHRLLPVLGSSGSGKSSLIRAGLIPTLRRGFRTRAGTGWRIVTMTPGNNPIGNLATALSYPDALGVADEDTTLRATMIETTLRRSDLGLVEAVRQARVQDNVLVLIDQFEEMFRVERVAPQGSQYEDQTATFVRLFLEAAAQEELPIYILLTLRTDFLGDCARFSGFPEAINKGQYLVPRLTREQRRSAIVGPIELRGAQIMPRLLHRLLNDVGDNPDQLPIMQHALMRTWDYWLAQRIDDAPIDLEHYEAIGTMTDALQRHADEAYNELPDEKSRLIAEQMFKRLTEKGADNREIQHPATLRDICAVTEMDQSTVVTVVETFRSRGRSFLTPGPKKSLTAETLLMISHESLIRVWKRLRQWVQEETRAAYDYLRLVDRMVSYREGRDTFLGSPALELALAWREKNQPNEAWAQRYHQEYNAAIAFLSSSQAEHDRKEIEKEAARRRELEQARALAKEQQRRFQEQRRAAKRLGMLALVLLLVFLAALAAAFYAWEQRQWAWEQRHRAERQARFSAAHERAMLALNNLQVDPELSVLLAMQAVNATYELDQSATPDAEDALNRALQALGTRHATLTEHTNSVRGVAFSVDGTRLVSADNDGVIKIWDLESPQVLFELPTTGQAVYDVALSPDGTRIASASHDGTITIWDVAGKKQRSWRGHASVATAVAFSPDSRQLASAGWDATVRLWEPDNGVQLKVLEGHTDAVTALAYNPTGTQLASAGWDKTVILWEPDSGQPLKTTLESHEAAVVALAYNTEGTRLASAGWDATTKLWDPATGVLRRTLGGHRGTVNAVAFNAAGTYLATAGWDATVRIWDVDSNLVWQSLSGHTDWVNALAFSPDGARLASASDDHSVFVWNIQISRLQDALSGYQAWQSSLALSPNGARLGAIVGSQVQVLNVRTGDITHSLSGQGTLVNRIAFSKDSSRLATFSDNQVREYYLNVEELLAAAQHLVARSLTARECLRYLRKEICPPQPNVGPDTRQSR